MFHGKHERRRIKIQRMEYLAPLSFDSVGNISGASNVQAKSLLSGPIRVTQDGQITGVRALEVDKFSISNFSANGSVSAEGPILNTTNGAMQYLQVSGADSAYGQADPYYTRSFSTQLPSSWPTRRFIWAISDASVAHLVLVQGTERFAYSFGVGEYSAEELVTAFNASPNGANCALRLSYDSEADKFLIYVDDAVGADQDLANPQVPPLYLQEFAVDATASLLLNFMGLQTTPTYSSGRVMESSSSTVFRMQRGSTQGWYAGGSNKDSAFSAWSPATQVWVGPKSSQTFQHEVIRSTNDARESMGASNEVMRRSWLAEDVLMKVEAMLSVPRPIPVSVGDDGSLQGGYFPSGAEVAAEPTRNLDAKVGELTDAGHVLLYSSDVPAASLDPTSGEPGWNGTSVALTSTTTPFSLALRERNSKRLLGGPTLALEGSYRDTLDPEKAGTVVYGAVKGMPVDFDRNDVSADDFGGRLAFYTGLRSAGNARPTEAYKLSSPAEAMRVDESQRVLMGNTSAISTLPVATYAPAMSVTGNVLMSGSWGGMVCTGGVRVGVSAGGSEAASAPLPGDLAVYGALSVTQDCDVGGNTTFGKNAMLETLNVSQSTSATNLTANGDVTLASAVMNAGMAFSGSSGNVSTGPLTKLFATTGALTATGGLLVSGANMTVPSGSTLRVGPGVLAANGGARATTLSCSGAVTLSNALSVSNVAVLSGAGTSGTATGVVNANGGLDVRGGMTASGLVTVQDSVSSTNMAAQAVTVGGVVTASVGIIPGTISGPVTMAHSSGLTVSAADGIEATTLVSSGLLRAQGGVSVTGGTGKAVRASLSGNLVAQDASMGNVVVANVNCASLSMQLNPRGAILMYAGSTAPFGWLMCDGSEVSRSTYAQLFAVIGTTYGVGDGSTTFNLPSLEAVQPVGRSGTRPLGSSGGVSSVTLSSATMPSHTHSVTVNDPGHTHTMVDTGHTHSDGGHTHPYDYVSYGLLTRNMTAIPGGTSLLYNQIGVTSTVDTGYMNIQTGYASLSASTVLSGMTNPTAANVGSGSSFDVLNPYVVVSYIIKT